MYYILLLQCNIFRAFNRIDSCEIIKIYQYLSREKMFYKIYKMSIFYIIIYNYSILYKYYIKEKSIHNNYLYLYIVM